MTPEHHNLILGVAGMFSTLLVAGLGFYFTARARSAPMREILYSEQLKLAQRLLRAFGRARIYGVLLDPDGEYRELANEAITREAPFDSYGRRGRIISH